MSTIHLTTFISAPAERVFDLSRSVSLHQVSMQHTKERAVGGKTHGLLELNDVVRWQAKHLFKTRFLQTKITELQRPSTFTDEMTEGDFKSLRHQHHFKEVNNGTIMIDLFDFIVPYGLVGSLVDNLYLKKYMKHLLLTRNSVIKEYAETNRWKALLL